MSSEHHYGSNTCLYAALLTIRVYGLMDSVAHPNPNLNVKNVTVTIWTTLHCLSSSNSQVQVRRCDRCLEVNRGPVVDPLILYPLESKIAKYASGTSYIE